MIDFQICLFFQFWLYELYVCCILFCWVVFDLHWRWLHLFFYMVCFKVRKESCLIVTITMNSFILFSHVMYCIIMYYKLILDDVVKSFHIYLLALTDAVISEQRKALKYIKECSHSRAMRSSKRLILWVFYMYWCHCDVIYHLIDI